MKKLVVVLFFGLLFSNCQKENLDPGNLYLKILASKMAATDFKRIDQTSLQSFFIHEGRQVLVRARMGEAELVVLFDRQNRIESGKILKVGLDSLTRPATAQVYSLDGGMTENYVIENGVARKDQVVRSSSMPDDQCDDCTIPEFITVTSYASGTSEQFSYYSLYWILGGSSPQDAYLPLYTDSGAGGDAISVDMIESTDKEKIDVQKFIDCFGQVSGELATYTITIAADLPVDRNSCVFFDWKDRFPGHAYVELSKSNPYSTVRQTFGFYPSVSFKVLTGHDIYSKVVNDGGHEYQARYTISVSAAQFQAAVNKLVTESTHPYNVSYYNCVNFAVNVFNAGGGTLSVPQYSIPGFGVPGGSSSPQGLYEQIRGLQLQGVPMAYTTQQKEFMNPSNGPCQ